MNKIIFLSFVLLVSCKSIRVHNSLDGEFVSSGKGYHYSLTLKNDSTFIYKQHALDVLKSCIGRWHYIDKGTILIQCAEEDIFNQISTGYMPEREKKVVIDNQKKIRIGQIVFKKLPGRR